MQFKQKKLDGSCKIEFSWRERFIILFRGGIFLDTMSFKHFVNTLMYIAHDWQMNFDEKIRNTTTNPDKDSIKGK